MQDQKLRTYHTSRFAEGRLKFSTACTECHKRKQKCDQQQPCRHCSRRYPQPQCNYLSKGDGAVSTGPSKKAKAAGAHKDGIIGMCTPQNEELDRNHDHKKGYAPDFGDISIDDQHDSNGDGATAMSRDVRDDFQTDSYQISVSIMVSRLTEVMISGEIESRKQLEEDREYVDASEAPQLPSTISVEPLHFLGITHTAEKAALLSAFVKLVSKYAVSLDGNPPPNYYNTHFVPWSIKSPLLSHISIFTTAALQSEAQQIPPNDSPLVLSYKLKSISLLNEKLLSKDKTQQTCNEAILAVSFLVVTEWYWSDFEMVRKHMRGLVEMVRLRGGWGELEMHEFLKKMIMIVDYNIACTYDRELSFPHNVASLPQHTAVLMTPLLSSRGASFASNAEELGIDKETAVILDDIRFLLLAIIKQVDRPTTAQERAKLRITATWTQDRISSLPSGNEPESPRANDFIYKSCRTAAQIYCRAIVERTPLSKACTLQDLDLLWASTWRISLTRWEEIPGIFLWILLSAIQGVDETPSGWFLKSMLTVVCTYMAVDYWDVVDGAVVGFVRLQRWLRSAGVGIGGGEEEEKGGRE